MSTRDCAAPALHKVLQPISLRAHQQTAIVRTVIDELERRTPASELANELELQLADELRRLARRVLDMADMIEGQHATRESIEPMAASGVRLRPAL